VHVVILGCGRVGSAVAMRLQRRGHSVAVVDQDAAAFRRLPETFQGRTVTGVGFDRDTLMEAGIESAAAFAAVSSGDNSNIIAARVARETFGVETVVARIYDPRRAEVYQRLGIPTVATVRWTAEQMVRMLLPESGAEWTDPTGGITVAQLPVDPAWIGIGLAELERQAQVRVVSLGRLGLAELPTSKSVVQDGDVLHVAVAAPRMAEVSTLLASPPVQVH